MADDRDLAPLRALVETWKAKAKDDAKSGAAQAMTSDREYYGRVNAAFAYRECADQLESALALASRGDHQPETAVPVDADLETCRLALSRALARHPLPHVRDALEAVLMAIVAANAAIDAEKGKP